MIIDRIFGHARATPDKPALIHNGVEWSYADFAQCIASAHAHLATLGLAPGGVVVLCMDSLRDGWFWNLALRDLGFNTLSVEKGEDIALLGLPDIRCVLTLESEYHRNLAVVAADPRWTAVSVPAMDKPAPGGVPQQPRRAAHPGGHILATSGTTGGVKLILRDAQPEADTLSNFADLMGISAQSVAYVRDFPLWTAAGYRWPLITWNEGGTVVCHQRPDFHQPLLDRRMTHMLATPMTLSRLLRAPELRRDDDMRILVTGGAVPRALATAVFERITRQVCLLYASTEGAMVGLTPVGGVDDLYWYSIHASREVQIVDEQDQVLPTGEVGLVRIRVFDGVNAYLGDEAASRAAFRDGWFYCGDLGVLDARGRLALHGRVTEFVNLLGSKVLISPIERAIQDALGAEGVCIFSRRGIGGDEEAHLAIQSSRLLGRAELEAQAKAHLGQFPRIEIHLVKELPRNAMGKIRRQELMRRLFSEAPSA